MTDTWWYRVARIDSWQRDKVTARGGKARTHRPKGDAKAKRAHALAAFIARPKGWDVNGCVEVEVVYCRVTGHARDTDRVLNLVLDALRGVAYLDDNDSRVLASSSQRLWAPWLVTVDRDAFGDIAQMLADGETLVIVRRVEGPPRAKRRAA